MLHNPYKIVKMFEEEVAAYTGAPFAVSTDSCTNAIFLCLVYLKEKYPDKYKEIYIPKKTYLSVPQSIMQAGYDVKLDDRKWKGIYNLYPTPVWDAAKRLTKGMYLGNQYMCLSFHIKKHLPIGKGGMILTNNEEFVEWAKKARYEGRSEVLYTEDDISSIGWNMYMEPTEAARGLMLMQDYIKTDHHEDLPENYRDLTTFKLFENKGI